MAFVHLAAAVSPFDDAYITFRYIDHLLRGDGAVYNLGERVFGISCPLYAAWLALLSAVLPGAGLPALAVKGNALFLFLAAGLAFLLLRRLGCSRAWSWTAAGAMVLSEGILRGSLGGMESSMFLALAFGALAATARRRDTLALTLASLSALTRPEGLLLLAVVCVPALASGKGLEARLRPFIGLAPLLVWVVAAGLYYGSPVPHSIVAKARPLYPLPPGAAFGHLASLMGRWALDGAAVAGGLSLSRILYQTSGIGLTVWAMSRWWVRARAGERSGFIRTLALPAWLAVTVLFYAVTNPLLLAWYVPLTQAPWILVMIAACRPSGPPGRRRTLKGLAAAGVALMILGTALASFAYGVAPTRRSLLLHGATDERQAGQLAAYERTARWIEGHTGPEMSVAAAEIGILGYRLERRIVDACGLVSPEALPFLPVPAGQRGAQLGSFSVELIQATRPDIVVTLPAFAERSLLRSDWFGAAYRLAHEEVFLPEDPRYRAVLVFLRQRGGESLR